MNASRQLLFGELTALTYYQGETLQMEFAGADRISVVLGYHYGK